MRGLPLGLAALVVGSIPAAEAQVSARSLHLAYPPDGHKTTSDRIFFIGSAPVGGIVTLNGQAVRRSAAGHFAPTVPLQVGDNRFELRYGDRAIAVTVTRIDPTVRPPQDLGFAAASLWPGVDVARLPGERLCFAAVATPGATVTAALAGQVVPLAPQPAAASLLPNHAVLTGLLDAARAPLEPAPATGQYAGCTSFDRPGALGKPEYRATLLGKTVGHIAKGTVTVLDRDRLLVAEVTVPQGVARSGPSADYSRLTPLPRGTRATVTAREGDWLRLDYGAWLRQNEVKLLEGVAPPVAIARGASRQQRAGWTDFLVPLPVAVPVTVEQREDAINLILHNAIAQTDTIRFDGDSFLDRLDWRQETPTTIRYTLHFASKQQWGYKLGYHGSTLVLSLRHPPKLRSPAFPLAGTHILLDPGHGGNEDLGARGPTGYPEKDITLAVAKLLRAELQQRGATVELTREGDEDILPGDRANRIEQRAPTLALSLHYNALPDNGDAWRKQGVSAFWYHPQSRSLARFLHDRLVTRLKRPSDGVYWNNLALTRPSAAPAVLLELGFAIHPEEFEWIIDPAQQKQLAIALAAGLADWVTQQTEAP